MTGTAGRKSHSFDELDMVEELESLAEAEASGEVDSPVLHRTRTGRSEVFSVRLPEAAALELRRRAELEGVSAGIVLRQWALSALTGPTEPIMTHQQAMALFRETLQEAAVQTVRSATAATAASRGGLNLGPKLVHDRAHERNRRLG